MNLFFSCNKSNSSVKNILEKQNNSTKNKEENINEENLLQSTNELNYNNDSTYNLEIIDYPYSSNFNDEKTETMNSNEQNNDSKNKTKLILNNLNPHNILQKERNNQIEFLKNNLDTYNSNDSSIINNNDDNIPQNKMLLKNYYINYNIINVNNVNNICNTDIKDEMNNVFNSNKKNEKEICGSNSKVKVDYPNPDSGLHISKSKNNIYFFNFKSTVDIKKKLSKKIKCNLKKNSKSKCNKTIEIQKKNAAHYRSNKTLEVNGLNNETISKIYLKSYNTSYLYLNKSLNNISINKINIGKFRNKRNKNKENQKFNIIKSRKSLNKSKTINIQRHKTIQQINQINKKRKSILFLKKNAQSKSIYFSNSSFKISLLNKKGDNPDNKGNNNQNKINNNTNNRIVKNRIKKKLVNKNVYINPFKEPYNTTKETI